MLPLRRVLAILAALLYVISPVDLIPDFLPGLGWLDDLLVLGLLGWYLTAGKRGRFPWDVFGRRPEGSRERQQHASPPGDLSAGFSRMDPYTLLEVSPQASPEEIKAAYKRAVARYHPDKVAHLGKEFQDLAHQKLLAIQQAYETVRGNGH